MSGCSAAEVEQQFCDLCLVLLVCVLRQGPCLSWATGNRALNTTRLMALELCSRLFRGDTSAWSRERSNGSRKGRMWVICCCGFDLGPPAASWLPGWLLIAQPPTHKRRCPGKCWNPFHHIQYGRGKMVAVLHRHYHYQHHLNCQQQQISLQTLQLPGCFYKLSNAPLQPQRAFGTSENPQLASSASAAAQEGGHQLGGPAAEAPVAAGALDAAAADGMTHPMFSRHRDVLLYIPNLIGEAMGISSSCRHPLGSMSPCDTCAHTDVYADAAAAAAAAHTQAMPALGSH